MTSKILKTAVITTLLAAVQGMAQAQTEFSSTIYKFINKANERENLDDVSRKGYEAAEWRMEAPNKDVKSVDDIFAFRWMGGPFRNTGAKSELPDTNYVPTRKGMDKMYLSGSSRLSDKEMQVVLPWLKEHAGDMPIYILDLRQETHGYVNGNHVSWYGYINWSNIGRRREDIMHEEDSLFHSLRGKTIVAGKISSSNNYIMSNAQYIKVSVDSAWTEKEMVEHYGLRYLRLAALDHVFPCDYVIDQFLDIYRSLPERAWVHMHCQAGRGRTTLWMSFFDMLRNPDLPMKDILYRQTQLGGTSLYYQGQRKGEQKWRVSLFAETSYLVPLLYAYVQDNKQNGYSVSWSEWKRQKFGR
ncbi:MAG: hypothetical protein K6A78_10115 [Prevotella sp.]|nr:hypothetical protein [Prevotella sp.]